MFVKALRLQGFKSFAAPTVLEFAPGVNVIVGPNGSGKSNIADALAWVMGSQAPSSLRGATMEDVIFAGSESRPRLGVAEIELTLDNSSRILPLDLEEVTISRSTDRSGASEYRINGAPCRLLDIAELLSDTGIGRSLHTVVGQGQLDAVLQARPEDRRSFIEEAAQIGKFRRRKDRALRKIERVDDNLLRLNDVLTELRRALRPLKRQARAAAAYSELVTRQQELRQRLAATELAGLAEVEQRFDPEAHARRAGLLSEELSTLRARLGTVASERAALTEAAEEAQGVAYGMARATDRLNALSRLAEERAGRLQARLAAETDEGYRERIRLLEHDRQRWAGALVELREAATEARATADRLGSQATEARRAHESAEQDLADARATETEAAQALVRAEGSEAAGRATIGALEARANAVVERRELAEEALGAAQRDISAAMGDVTALEKELDSATDTAASAETALEEARDQVEMLRVRVGAAHADRTAAAARLQAFREAAQVLADLPEARSRLEPLIESSEAQAAVAVAGEEDAAAMVASAEAVVEERWTTVARADEELRRLDALMSGAAERVAGHRRQKEARDVERATLDEELARVRDALAEAERAAAEERAALPARQAAARETQSKRATAEQVVAEARERARTLTEQAADAELTARGQSEQALAAQLRFEEAEAGIADARRALAGLKDLRAALSGQQARAEQVARAALLAGERGVRWAGLATQRAEKVRQQAHAAEDRLSEMQAREREVAGSLEEITGKRNEAEIRRAETRARTQAIGERAMEEWGLSVDALRGIDVFPTTEESDARSEAERLDREMRRLGAVNPHAAEEYSELAEREQFLVDQMEDLKSSRRDLLRVVREVDDTIIESFDTAFRDVAREFEDVFNRLFPGGSGRISLTDPNDLLASGIDIEARPPGKNVRKLSLLSGGERSLVALAFLFAIFRAKPSPFYLLDEVEAALDDVNLQRFITLVAELEERAQVMIVTHQKRTMEAADVLYGVTMGKDGVSTVVAKRMEEVAS